MALINPRRIIVDWDRRWDRFKTEGDENIRLEHKLAYFNEAQEIYFENRVDVAESNASVRQDLRLFERKKVELKRLESGPECDIYLFPEDMFRKLRHSAIVEKGTCGKKEIPIILYQMDDLDLGRKSTYWKSSYEWEHLLGDEGEKGFYLWHDGAMKVRKVFIDYFRKPQEAHAPSMRKPSKQYLDWNGILRTKDQGCEFSNTYQFRKIMAIAIYLARVDKGDVKESQLILNQIFETEKINS